MAFMYAGRHFMADISKRKDLIRACYAPDAQSADQMIAVLGQYGISAVRFDSSERLLASRPAL